MTDPCSAQTTAPTTVAGALAGAHKLGLDRLDAHLLLGRLLQQPRTWLITHDETVLTAPVAQAFVDACQRRADGQPLAYLLGEREFHGLLLHITPDVLVPRPDTETLVDWALDLLSTLTLDLTPSQPRVLDLGTGSGAIALAIAHRHPSALVTATDLSLAALAVARANARRLGLSLQWANGAWWQALGPAQRFDLVLCNPPYIAADDPHLPALRHEPLAALVPGEEGPGGDSPGGEGLSALRHVIGGAAPHLAPGAWLLLEHGWAQAGAVSAALHRAGFAAVSTRCDIEGRPRCTGGQYWPAGPAPG